MFHWEKKEGRHRQLKPISHLRENADRALFFFFSKVITNQRDFLLQDLPPPPLTPIPKNVYNRTKKKQGGLKLSDTHQFLQLLCLLLPLVFFLKKWKFTCCGRPFFPPFVFFFLKKKRNITIKNNFVF